MISRGSEWRRWNFHVHTKGTNKNDQFSSQTMDEFFFTFFKKAYEKQISAIGITDYFTIDKYLETVEYKNSIENKIDPDNQEKLFTEEEIIFIKEIFLFPNVELRMLPSTDRGKLINIHCIFNPDYEADLEHDFFAKIENQDGYQMNRHGITNYGKTLDRSLQTNDSQFEKGLQNFTVDPKCLIDLIRTNKRIKDNTLFVVSNSSNDGASAMQKHYELFENEGGSLDGVRKSVVYQM